MANGNDTEDHKPRQAADPQLGRIPEDENVEAAQAQADAIRTAQLDMLARMRAVAMEAAEALNNKVQALARDSKSSGSGEADLVLALTRLSRSMLQVMAMEQEIIAVRMKERGERRWYGNIRHEKEAERRREEKQSAVRAEVKELASKALATGQYPAARRNLLAGLMTGIFKNVLNDQDFEGLSQREIVARICTELRIADPDLSIWPDDRPAVASPATADAGADCAAADHSGPSLPDPASAAALAGARPPPAHTNGHDPP